MSENIEIKLFPVRKFFYSDESNYGIYACRTEEQGKVMLNGHKNFSIKGNTVELKIENEYKATLLEKKDKFGIYYEIQSVFEDIPTDGVKQRAYLSTLLTENQVNEIYKVYPGQDIIQLVRDGEFDFEKVKGIGKKTYEKIKDKLIENLEFQQAFEFLSKYGVTNNMIIKLVKHFKSASLLIKKMQINPYIITAVNGVGFKKADAIAMSMGYDPKGEFRILSAIEFIIEDESTNGHTYVSIGRLIDSVEELIAVEYNLIGEYIKDTENVIVTGDRAALRKFYKAEQDISNKFKDLLNRSSSLNIDIDKLIVEQEKEHNINLTDQQKEFFTNVFKNRASVLTGYAGCVDMYTEYFNGYEWKKIFEYQEGEKVLQYNENGEAELVEPLAFQKLPETKMTLVKTDLGSINQCLSDDHTVIYKTSKGNIAKLPFSEIARRHKEVPNGFYGKFITHFKYNGHGINLNDEKLRVMVMIIADGHFPNKTSKCIVRIKKHRKIERVRILLENANIPYSEKDSVDNYKVFAFAAPIRLKSFDSSWFQCSQHQLQVIVDEVLHWDGSIDAKGRKRFNSNVKESAEFIQFAFTATGHRATIVERDRTGQLYKDSKYIRQTKEYTVMIAQGKNVSLFARTPDKKTPLVEVEPEDGHKYCFTVPSEMWVMRREGRICVTGNCGKSQLVAFLINILEETGHEYRLLSPTGKAAKVLANYTNRSVETIHRAIGLGENKRSAPKVIEEEFVIIDETSMVDVLLCKSLLEKCVHPNVRIIFIGDDAQIASVSAGNILHDLIYSGAIPTTKLDIVFRQKDMGLIDVATKIRQQERFLDNNFWGIQTFGNNCTVACVPQEKIVGGYKYYMNEMLKEYSPEDIMVLSPTKKSELGTIEINKVIQEIVNPGDGVKLEKEFGYNKTLFRENDMVINTRNTYDILNVNEQEVNIVNGDVGVIEKIDESQEEVIVDFGFDRVPIPFGKLDQLMHSWCITKHKSQGSGSPVVIIIMDKAHKFQINTNLLYTAITRCKEKLILLTQAETVNFALRKVANKERNTFLKEFLMNEEE